MSHHHPFTLSLCLGVAVALTACDTEAEPPPQSEQAAVDADAPPQVAAEDGDPDNDHARHRRGHRPNPVAHLCEQVDCSDTQRDDLEALFAEVRGSRGDRAKHKDARRQHAKAIADAFRAETFDPSTIEEAMKGREGKHEERKQAMQTLAVGVHDILTSEQRDALADRVETGGLHMFGARGPGKGGRKGHHGRRSKRGGPPNPERMIDRMCEHLECSPEQRGALGDLARDMRNNRPDPATREAAQAKLADALRAETLSVEQLEAHHTQMQAMHGAGMAARRDAMVRFHAILTPEQRAKLADRIEEGGPLPLMGRPHRGRP